MADTKISALAALAGVDVAAADVLPIVDTSAVTTKSVSVQALNGAPQVVQSKAPTTPTTYTLVAGNDAGTLWHINSASNVTIQVTSAAGFVAGQRVDLLRRGSGTVQVTLGTGATLLLATPGAFLRAQGSMATIYALSSTEFVLAGDLTA